MEQIQSTRIISNANNSNQYINQYINQIKSLEFQTMIVDSNFIKLLW